MGPNIVDLQPGPRESPPQFISSSSSLQVMYVSPTNGCVRAASPQRGGPCPLCSNTTGPFCGQGCLSRHDPCWLQLRVRDGSLGIHTCIAHINVASILHFYINVASSLHAYITWPVFCMLTSTWPVFCMLTSTWPVFCMLTSTGPVFCMLTST